MSPVKLDCCVHTTTTTQHENNQTVETFHGSAPYSFCTFAIDVSSGRIHPFLKRRKSGLNTIKVECISRNESQSDGFSRLPSLCCEHRTSEPPKNTAFRKFKQQARLHQLFLFCYVFTLYILIENSQFWHSRKRLR